MVHRSDWRLNGIVVVPLASALAIGFIANVVSEKLSTRTSAWWSAHAVVLTLLAVAVKE